MEEVWKPVVGYEELYEVSNLGRVKSLEREVRCGRHYRFIKCIVMKPGERRGYMYTTLCGKKKSIHRLVAESFIPNPENLPFVNHKDENRQNNFVFVNPDGTIDTEKSNLEWCTNSYNQLYGGARERSKNTRIQKGTYQNENCKKPVYQLDMNGKIIKKYSSIAEAARSVGGNTCGINRCCLKKRHYYTAYGYKWEWA